MAVSLFWANYESVQSYSMFSGHKSFQTRLDDLAVLRTRCFDTSWGETDIAIVNSKLPDYPHMLEFRRIRLWPNTPSKMDATQIQSAVWEWKIVFWWLRLSCHCGKAGLLASKHYINPTIWLTFFLITLLFYFTMKHAPAWECLRLLCKL